MLFKIKIAYFKDSGKLYTSAEVDMDFSDVGPPGAPVCSMHEVVDWVKNANLTAGLPGLGAGGGRGPVFVDCEEHGYPCLVLPDWVLKAAREREERALQERWA